MTRAAPQLNIFGIGFPVTLGVGLLVLAMVLPYLAVPFQNMFLRGIETARLLPRGFAGARTAATATAAQSAAPGAGDTASHALTVPASGGQHDLADVQSILHALLRRARLRQGEHAVDHRVQAILAELPQPAFTEAARHGVLDVLAA